ncbi:MAG: hypothetical protein GC186_06860 [Rhodobacteraceae bacterium]|nr:hypothetical protein [Paracoccaceae bacterium]
MGWFDPVNGYCERLGPGLWAEPLNAVTNLAFLLAAAILWPRVRGVGYGRSLCGVLIAIGVGSALFHTVAERWAALADVLPILGFILLYLWAVNRGVWHLGRAAAGVGVALFFPFAAITGWGIGRLIPALGSSAGYAPVALLILLYAAALARRAPAFAANLALGAAILGLSITARAVDLPLCPRWPEGTHFLWHLLNALMLGWMIEALRRQMLAAPAPPR